MKFDSKPMLMQLAEPEFMCPKCGDKFYIYDVDKKPNKCGYCDLVFDWTYRGDISDEEFKRIVDKSNALGCTSFNRMSLGEEAWEAIIKQENK